MLQCRDLLTSSASYAANWRDKIFMDFTVQLGISDKHFMTKLLPSLPTPISHIKGQAPAVIISSKIWKLYRKMKGRLETNAKLTPISLSVTK